MQQFSNVAFHPDLNRNKIKAVFRKAMSGDFV
jgi:hypothetical protein